MNRNFLLYTTQRFSIIVSILAENHAENLPPRDLRFARAPHRAPVHQAAPCTGHARLAGSNLE